MALNKDFIKELCKRMRNVSKRRVYQKIKEIEEEQLLSKEEAACILGHTCKVSLKKYFDQDVIKGAREILQKGKIQTIRVPSSSKIEVKETLFKVGFDKIFRDIKEPLLPKSIINDAKKMVSYYPLFYIFENSIRNFIIQAMRKKYGEDWWNTKLRMNNHFNKICQKVDIRRVAENENRFHGKRGAHEIYYTDIDDLNKIIDIYFPDFRPILNQPKSFYDHMLRTINLSRRIIAHNNPLAKRDFDRIKHAFADWCDQLNLAKGKLRMINNE